MKNDLKKKSKNLAICLTLMLVMFSAFISSFSMGLYNLFSGRNSSNLNLASGGENFSENNQSENSRFTVENNNSANVVKVPEIWDSTKNRFKTNELNSLMQLASKTTATIENLSAIDTLLSGDKRIKSSDIRTNNGGKDLVVTMGGLEWTATYLSKDKNNNPILTLWLTNSTQLAGKDVYITETTNGAIKKSVFNSGATTKWNSGFSPSDTPNSAAPDAMYGTSYIRAVVLNNGGRYSIQTGGGSDINGSAFMSATKKNDSVFSPFTVTTKELTGSTTNKTRIADHLVAPVNVSWQEYQSYKEVKVDPTYLYNIPNEGWVNGQVSSNYYTDSEGNYNYSNKTNYGVWKDDLIWLPSLTETGWRDGDRIGLWSTNTNQRSNPNDYSWLRSGGNDGSYGAYVLYPSGADDNLYYVSSAWACRPSLHLSLNSAAASARLLSKDLWVDGSMNARNLASLLKYISGSAAEKLPAGYLADIVTQLGAGSSGLGPFWDSRTIYTNANKNADKTWLDPSTNELIVELGGLKWYAVYLSKEFPTSKNLILTLYLANSGQLYNKNYMDSGGTAVVKFNQYGSASWNSGESPYRSPTEEYPIYSTSFMRENVLNNKYDLVNSNYSTQSVFALFTTSTYSQSTIADFLYTPSQVQWQNGQSAKNTLAFRYNLLNEAPNNLNNFSKTYSFLKTTALENSSSSVMLTNSICHAERSEASYNNVILSASEESIPITLNAPIMYSAVGTADTQTTLALTILETYDIWKYDRLWLPSLTETGGGDKVGLWKLSNAQRKNTNGTASWLRSGHMTISNSAYTLTADGTNYGYATINTQNGIRPALHLNLTLASALAV